MHYYSLEASVALSVEELCSFQFDEDEECDVSAPLKNKNQTAKSFDAEVESEMSTEQREQQIIREKVLHEPRHFSWTIVGKTCRPLPCRSQQADV